MKMYMSMNEFKIKTSHKSINATQTKDDVVSHHILERWSI
jgi:hypothetical protein